MKYHHGAYYFESEDSARTYATEHGYPTDRILYFGRGWAIQGGISGDYAGPHGLKIGDWPHGVLKPLDDYPASQRALVRSYGGTP